MLMIFLSFIGVFGGIVITGSAFVIMMTMVGIISRARIIVPILFFLSMQFKMWLHRKIKSVNEGLDNEPVVRLNID